MKNIGIISGIVVIVLILIFVAYTKKWDKEEIERGKTSIPKPELKSSSLSGRFQALLFIIFMIALVLTMLFLNTGGNLDWIDTPKGFAE